MRIRSTVILSAILTVVLISFLSLVYVSYHHPSLSDSSPLIGQREREAERKREIDREIERDREKENKNTSNPSIFHKRFERKEDLNLRSEEVILLSHEFNGDIFLDWVRESHQFNYLNYKSLESLLATYSHANFEFTIIGPQAANYYKLGNLMSKHIFEKYKKRGYPIRAHVVSDLTSIKDLIGSSYWKIQEKKYCVMNGPNSFKEKLVPPYHVFFFIRLQKLLLKVEGGIFTDLSWIHLRPFSLDINTGFTQRTSCSINSNNDNSEELLRPIESLHSPNFTQYQSMNLIHCYTSSLMVFRQPFTGKINRTPGPASRISTFEPNVDLQPHRVILICMLQKFDGNIEQDESDLVQCIQKEPAVTGGALCIQRALKDCFLENQIPNQLSPILQFPEIHIFDDNSQKATEFFISSTTTSSLLLTPSPLINLFKDYHEYYQCFLSVSNEPSLREYLTSLNGSFTPPSNREMCLNSLRVASIWMGTVLGVGQRNEFGPKDWIFPPIDSRLALVIELNQHRLTKNLDLHDLIADKFRGDKFQRNFSETHCHPYFERPQTRSLIHHPLSRSDAGRARTSCSISFVLSGFMKSATSFLFESLVRHPQILHALRGVRYKETGCYLPERGNIEISVDPFSRHDCFPFLEEYESAYIYGDGTVTYSLLQGVPIKLKRDNPNIKAIFVVRDPVHRFISHFKFSIEECRKNGIPDVLDAIEHLFARDQNSPIFKIRRAAERLLAIVKEERNTLLSPTSIRERVSFETRDFLDLFFRGFDPQSKKDRLTMTLIHNSLYFPALFHWIQILGPENVIVIQTELLHLSYENIKGNNNKEHIRQVVREQLDHVHKFLGIVPFDGVLHTELHSTGGLIGKKYPSLTDGKSRGNNTALDRLKEYFAPFNELLTELLRATKVSPELIVY